MNNYRIEHKKRRLAQYILLYAGFYNIVWGAIVVLFPSFLHQFFTLEPPKDILLWQCIGMFVGVFGLGYIVTATDPERYWVMVAVGLLGKICGISGYLSNLALGNIDPKFIYFIITNDIIWIIPFYLILYWTYFSYRNSSISTSKISLPKKITEEIESIKLSNGETLKEYSEGRSIQLIFLRHAGCTFCRIILDKVSRVFKSREEREKLIIVHPGKFDDIEHLMDKYKINDIPVISDESLILYNFSGLSRGNLKQLFGFREIISGTIGILKGYGIGFSNGDPLQLGGNIIIKDSHIVKIEQHQRASDTDVTFCDVCYS